VDGLVAHLQLPVGEAKGDEQRDHLQQDERHDAVPDQHEYESDDLREELLRVAEEQAGCRERGRVAARRTS